MNVQLFLLLDCKHNLNIWTQQVKSHLNQNYLMSELKPISSPHTILQSVL